MNKTYTIDALEYIAKVSEGRNEDSYFLFR
jgi:hypothetical protein